MGSTAGSGTRLLPGHYRLEELKGRGMTIITEADGLDIAAFRESVNKQIAQDFPDFTPLIEQIQAVK